MVKSEVIIRSYIHSMMRGEKFSIHALPATQKPAMQKILYRKRTCYTSVHYLRVCFLPGLCIFACWISFLLFSSYLLASLTSAADRLLVVFPVFCSILLCTNFWPRSCRSDTVALNFDLALPKTPPGETSGCWGTSRAVVGITMPLYPDLDSISMVGLSFGGNGWMFQKFRNQVCLNKRAWVKAMTEVVKKPSCSRAGQKLMNKVDMIGIPH